MFESTRDFMRSVHCAGTVSQICTLDRVVWASSGGRKLVDALAENIGRDLYFLAGVKPELAYSRSADNGILKRKHIAFDFDIRVVEKYKSPQGKEDPNNGKYIIPEVNLTSDELCAKANEMVDELNKSELFKDWSYIVMSGNGIHVHYLGDEFSISKKDYSDALHYLLEKIEEVTRTKPDPACSNIGRILRLPGSTNYKYARDIYSGTGFSTETKFVQNRPTVSGLLSKMDEFAGLFRENVKKGKSKKRQRTVKLPYKIEKEAKLIDCKMGLMRLSGKDEVNSEVYSFSERPGGGEYILFGASDTTADCWLDKNGMIGSGSEGGPYIYNWIAYYGHSDEKILEILEKYFLDKIPIELFDEIRPRKTIADYILDVPDTDVVALMTEKQEVNKRTWGIQKLDEEYGRPRHKEYIVFLGEAGSGKTAFCMQMAARNQQAGIRTLYISLEMDRVELIKRTAEIRAGVSESEREAITCWNDYKPHQQMAIRDCQRELGALKIVDKSDLGNNADFNFLFQALEEYEMIFFDNLGYITDSSIKSNTGEFEEQRIISRQIWDKLRETPRTVIILHHVAKNQKISNGASGRGSSKIKDDVTREVGIERNKLDIVETSVKFFSKKDRHRGREGFIDLQYNNGIYS